MLQEEKKQKNQKILELSNSKIKRKLSKALSHNSLFFLFLKILLIFLCTMIPVVAHNIINIKHGAALQTQGQIELGKNYLNAAQAIGYAQPMVFFSTISLTIISLNVMNALRQNLDTKNRKNQPKDIINTGIVYVFITTLIISILLVGIMAIYANFVLSQYKYDNKIILKKYLMEYVSIVTVFILLTGLSLYFEMLIVECGINYWMTLVFNILFLTTDINLAITFNYKTNLDPIASVLLGTTISVFVRFLIYSVIFWKFIANWKPWQIRPYMCHIKSIWNNSWVLCTYMLMYSVMMVVQIMFMSLIILDDRNAYMIVDGHYIMIVTRIAVYNILNLIIVIPKSMSNALVVKYRNQKSTPLQRLRSFEIARRFSIITIWTMAVVGLIIWSFSDKIVDNIYGDFYWAHEIIRVDYPVDYFGVNAKYIDIIKDFFTKGLFCGIIAQFMINYSVYYRVIVYSFLHRDKKNFLFLMILFAICYGIGNYLFGVYLQWFFKGILGFMLTLFIYGCLSIVIVKVAAYRNKRMMYNLLLKERYDDHLEQWWEIGPINYYRKIKYYKKIVMTDCVVKYI